jgi:hypothetical protein
MSSDDVQRSYEQLAPEHHETAIVVLEGMGHGQAAKHLRAAAMTYEFAEYDNWDGGTYVYDVHLHVDARKLGSYDEAVCTQISEALNKVSTAVDGFWIGKIIPVPRPVTSSVLSNQAVDPTNEPVGPSRHRMRFRGDTEALMFDSLATKQQLLPRGDTILIVPLPSVWTGQHRWEPDFLITYRGRVGVIEIDDPTHFKRYAADKSRDQVLEECGVHLVRRITVEDAEDEEQRKEFIEIFLQRLSR